MTNRRRFIVNTALLTLSGLLMRCVGCAFQVWLAARIGSTGIGLYQLMGSAVTLAVTFAVSGIGFGSTRLVSEELGQGSSRGASAAVTRCGVYALLCSVSTAAVLYRFAEPIGFLCIGDGRTVLPLQIMALELPFLSVGCVFHGYFTACSRLGRATAIQFAQQLVSVGLTVCLLSAVPPGDIEANCTCIALAGTLSEALGCLSMAALYFHDLHTHARTGSVPSGLWKRLLNISLPLAVSAYARSGLSTLQHMLTPAGLRRSGLTAAQALSAYGVIHGMAMTILYFPTCILLVVAQLLIPHLTGLQVQGQHQRIRALCRRMLCLCNAYAAVVAVGLFVLADLLGMGLYHNPEVAGSIRVLVPLVPLIYLDILVDGCLKGLGQQLWSMGINIAESAISVVLTVLLIPKLGTAGYLCVIYFNEVFNFLLSWRRLRQVVQTPQI